MHTWHARNTVMRHLSHVSSWKLFCDLHLQSFHVRWRFFSVSLVCFSCKCAKRERDKVKEGSELESGWPSLQQRDAESSQQQSSWVLVTVSLDYQWQPTEKVCASESSPPQSLAASTHRQPCVSMWSVREGKRLSMSSTCVCARVCLRVKVCEYAGRFRDNIYMWAEATVQQHLNLASSQSVYSCYNTRLASFKAAAAAPNRQFRLSLSFYRALI